MVDWKKEIELRTIQKEVIEENDEFMEDEYWEDFGEPEFIEDEQVTW